MHRDRQGRIGRVGGLLVLAFVAGACGESPTEVESDLPDGAYRIVTDAPRVVNEFVTPGWMRETPRIDFTKEGDLFVVTASADELVVVGPVQEATREDGFWRVRFGWAPHAVDGDHYWEIAMTRDECVASAVDADLGVGPDGVLTVNLRECGIEQR